MLPLTRFRKRTRFFGISGPSLAFDFANNGPFDPRITFTRASSATYFDDAGTLQSAAIDVPRLDYDPATLLPRGFLVEEQRTNRILYSENFGNASWVKAGGRVVVTTNQIAAPDGTVTADFLEANGGASGSRSISQTDTSSATGKSQSVFAKAGTATFLQILFGTDTAPWANFDLSTGTVGSTGTVTSATITPVGNGWYRCQVTTASTTATNATIGIVSSSTAVRNESNTLSAGLYIWGAQLEAGAFPTSYIPTTTTALTRSADVAAVNTLSPWYNSTEWTLYAEWQRDTTANAATGGGGTVPRVVSLNRAATASDFQIRLFSATSVEAVASGASPQGNVASNWAASTVVKSALRYQVDNFALDTNLGPLAIDTSVAAQPVSDQLALGQARTAANVGYLSGWLRRVIFYPRALSDAELDAITA